MQSNIYHFRMENSSDSELITQNKLNINNYLYESKYKCNEHLHNIHIIILPITSSTEQSLYREDSHLSSQEIPRLGFITFFTRAWYVDNDFSYLFAIAREHKLKSNYMKYLSKAITNGLQWQQEHTFNLREH
jgi:hypothetical protein